MKQKFAKYQEVLKAFKIPYTSSFIDETKFEILADGSYRKLAGDRGYSIHANGQEVKIIEPPKKVCKPTKRHILILADCHPDYEYLMLHITKYRAKPFVYEGKQVFIIQVEHQYKQAVFTLEEIIYFEIEGVL